MKAKMDVIIVCHTEFGFVDGGSVVYEKTATDGVIEGCRNLIRIAETYGAKITFAVMPEVAAYFPGDTNHEVGLHIHPGWQQLTDTGKMHIFTVGDSVLREHCRQSSSSTVLRVYSYEEQLDMIKTGKECLQSQLGVIPKVFVAGRWSLNNDTVKALIETGFTHECSAVPSSIPSHHDWSQLPRICPPYYPSEHNYQKEGTLSLLMVPTSQIFPRGVVSPEMTPMVGLSWLKACFREYHRQELPFFHITLHSPSMTDSSLSSAMEELIKFISCHANINFKFASEIKKYSKIIPKTLIAPYIGGINRKILLKIFNRLRGFITFDVV